MIEAIWLGVLGLFLAAYLVLEGFDYGVAALAPLIGKTREEQDEVIGIVAPFWDANEVWLIAAAALMFAALPGMYATLLSALYPLFLLLLLVLILRGVAFEFRGELDGPGWHRAWTTTLATTSLAAAFLWGLVLANLAQGLPIDQEGTYQGGLLTLVTPYALLGGLTTASLFTLHGANLIQLTTKEPLSHRAHRTALWIGAVATAAALALVVATYLATPLFDQAGLLPGPLPLAAGMSLVAIRPLLTRGKSGWAFVMGGLTILLGAATLLWGLYPRAIISTVPGATRTVSEVAATGPTLWLMLGVVAVLLPIILTYQAWSYRVLGKRVGGEGAY